MRTIGTNDCEGVGYTLSKNKRRHGADKEKGERQDE